MGRYAFTFYLTHAPPCAAQDAGCARERTLSWPPLRLQLLAFTRSDTRSISVMVAATGYGTSSELPAEARDVIEEYLDSPALGSARKQH